MTLLLILMFLNISKNSIDITYKPISLYPKLRYVTALDKSPGRNTMQANTKAETRKYAPPI